MKSYLKFLSRNKLYAAIEFIGLAVSLAFVILIGSYVRQQVRIARGEPEWKHIYAVGVDYDCVQRAPRAGLAGLFKDNIPEIEKATDFCSLGLGGKFDGEALNDAGCIQVSPDFLDMFRIQWVAGDPSSLLTGENVAVSESFAQEFSPDRDIIGRLYEDSRGQKTVTAVYRDLGTSMFNIDNADFLFVIVNATLASAYTWQGGCTCFVQSQEAEDKLIADIDATLESHFRKNYDRDESRTMKNGCYERLDRLYFSDLNDGQDGLMRGNRSLLSMLSAVVLLLLLSAVFNYINLSSALASRRVKEMAIRSVLGASKGQIVWGYLREALLFTVVSTVAAVLLAHAFKPMFSHYVDAKIGYASTVAFSWDSGVGLVALVAGLALAVGLLAGWIPSRIASRFDVIQVVKGDYRVASKRTLSKLFIIFQACLSVLMIAFSLVLERQYSHMINRPLGADIDGLYRQYLVRGSGHEDAVLALPFVEEYGRSDGFPGDPYMVLGVPAEEAGEQLDFAFMQCDTAAFKMFRFEVAEDYHAPGGKGSWLSESAFRRLGLDPSDPVVPEYLQYYLSQIAGVLKDFAVSDAAHVADNRLGVVNVVDPDATRGSLVLRISGDRKAAEKELQELYKRYSLEKNGYEGIPTLSGYMKDKLDDALGEALNYMRLIELFMFLAVLVSLLGLLAMSALYASERTHDIAVRKVFGSTVGTETLRAVREYMILVGIACLFAVPVAVWISRRYLEDYNYRISDYGWIFAVAVLITLVISFASVLWQDLKAARTDPATELKKE